MGKFLNKFNKGLERSKNIKNNVLNKVQNNIQNRDPYKNTRFNNPNIRRNKSIYDADDFNDDNFNNNDFNNLNDDLFDDARVQVAQKPESFHYFILENQYQDLEKSIRGIKDVWDKENQKWVTKKKDFHCFTTEEAEEILRMVQSHLSPDIKLSYINSETFGEMMDAIYSEVEHFIRRILEYRLGRYTYEQQGKLQTQGKVIFLEIWTRIQANYSRAIQGSENKAAHDSVRAQESLQQTDRDYTNRGYS